MNIIEVIYIYSYFHIFYSYVSLVNLQKKNYDLYFFTVQKVERPLYLYVIVLFIKILGYNTNQDFL
jgi:hypothetical protein